MVKQSVWIRSVVAGALVVLISNAGPVSAVEEPTSPQLAEGGPPLTGDVEPTPEPTPTPTPGPTPEPTPADKCPYFEVRVKRHGHSQATHSNPTQMFDETKDLACLKSYAKSLHAEAAKGAKNYYDDRIFFLFAQDYLGGNSATKGTRKNGFKCNQVEKIHGNKVGKGGNYCVAAVGYFDQSCDPVLPETVLDKCGPSVELGFQINFIRSSPISLIWEEGFDIDRESSIVNFSLHPHNQRPWTAWKASEKAPLLVFDPKKTGVVNDVTQLFGTWAFGGKQTAYAATNAAPGVLDGPWENGYAALATLDRNADGIVSGNELDDLSLWFDRNRDGVSQPGEMVSIHEAGVTSLRYAIDSRDPVSHTLKVNQGFTRVVDGVERVGVSVDWYGETAATEWELINSLMFASLDREAVEPTKSVQQRVDQLPVSVTGSGTAPAAIGGMWEWTVQGNESQGNDANAQAGLFLLSDVADSDAIKGHSLVELGFQSSPSGKLKSAIHSFMLLGTKKLVDGKTQISFETTQGDAALRNTATLSADGSTLVGTTEASVRIEGRSRVISYGWEAKRSAE